MNKIPAQTCKAYWIVPPVRKENNCMEIVEKSAHYFCFEVSRLVTRSRLRELSIPRMIIMHGLYFNTKLKPSMKYIGKIFNRDHTTVINAIKAVKNMCETDDDMFLKVKEYHEHIYGHLDYFNAGIRKKKQLIKL